VAAATPWATVEAEAPAKEEEKVCLVLLHWGMRVGTIRERWVRGG
jgi:hypothetical protein